VLDAEELRDVVRELLPELDYRAGARVVDGLVERAVRKGKGWKPDGPSEEAVLEIVAFAEAAARAGHADAERVEAFLRRGSDAFHRKDYQAARLIFRALLPPLADGELYLGQHETVDEVLGTDPGLCAARYLVSVYMTSSPDRRAVALRTAIGEVGGLALFWEPLERMERAAVEPFPDLDGFLLRWRSLLEESAGENASGEWLSDEDRQLREVVRRMDGTDGLAQIGRSTRGHEDLREWCRALVEARDWKAALSAFEEAAEIVRDGQLWRGEFLDGAALAAQELGRKDLPARLERAWREAPSLLRLRRWLGSVGGKARVRRAASLALAACPRTDECQRSVLHAVLGNHESAAKCLAAAPGIGWSDSEHPGHVIFGLLHRILGGRAAAGPAGRALYFRRPDLDELGELIAEPHEPRVRAPELREILAKAGVKGQIEGGPRAVVLAALRTATEKRIAGVIKQKRRRHYDHAACLVAMCDELYPNSNTWVKHVRAKYSRYPALQRELDRRLAQA
jgi:hypothetical protein